MPEPRKFRKFKKCRRYNDPGHVHALTFCTYRRQQFLAKDRTCEWLAEAISSAHQKHQFDVWAYVFMPEHVHLLINPRQSDYSISKILASIKLSVSRKAIRFVKENSPEFLLCMLDQQPNGTSHYRFWQRGGGFDRNIENLKTILIEINYLHANPVRRGLCEKEVDFKWSSAADYAKQRTGPLTIDFESLPTEIVIE